MWNPLTPAEVVAAMGAPARAAARAPEPLEQWERAQLLSVYSATRHLAAELAGVEPHTPVVAAELAAVLRAGPPALAPIADELAATTDPRALADAACRALDVLREAGDEATRAAVRRVLAAAVRHEVTVLADAIEGP